METAPLATELPFHRAMGPQSKTQSSDTSIDQQPSVPAVPVISELQVTSSGRPLTAATLPVEGAAPPSAMSTDKSFRHHRKTTVRPPPASTANAPPISATAAVVKPPPRPKLHSTPIPFAPMPTRVSGAELASQATSPLKVHQPAGIAGIGPLPSLRSNLHTPTRAAAEPTVRNVSHTEWQPFQPSAATSGTLTRYSTCESLRDRGFPYSRHLQLRCCREILPDGLDSGLHEPLPGVYREGVQVMSSSFFALEKHDIRIVVGVSASLIMIFVTMCVYSIRQRKEGNREAKRRMLPESRRPSQDPSLEMHTHDNRAFVEESEGVGTERICGERELGSLSSLRQPAGTAITIRAEFALVGLSERLVSISGNSPTPLSHRSPPEGEPQEAGTAVVGGSGSFYREGAVGVPDTWKRSPPVQGSPPREVVMVAACGEAEVPTRSKSTPCNAGRREEPPGSRAQLPPAAETRRPPHCSLPQLSHPGVGPGRDKPTPGRWPRAPWDRREVSEMTAEPGPVEGSPGTASR